jgi:hypothetical protein
MDGRNKRAANARTWAEKEQRKRPLDEGGVAITCGMLGGGLRDRMRPTASRRQHLSTQDARSAGFLIESRQVFFHPHPPSIESQIAVDQDPSGRPQNRDGTATWERLSLPSARHRLPSRRPG